MSSVFIESRGRLSEVRAPLPWPRLHYRASLGLGDYGECDDVLADPRDVYATNPDIRTIVDYLAVNVAQVGLHVYRRMSENENDRQRARGHPLARALDEPWPGVTQFDLLRTTVTDVCLHGQGFWIKVERPDDVMGLLPVVPEAMVAWDETTATGQPAGWTMHQRDGGDPVELSREQVVWHHTYDGHSPLEALGPLIAEDRAASRYRQQLWANGARFSGFLTRPPEAPGWNAETRERFRSEWRAWYTGGGPEAGGTPILEDGMSYVAEGGVTAEQAQYLEVRKLSLIQKAAAFRVPPPMVGILDHANYSNIRQLHQSLYTDTLGPWFRQLEQTIQSELVPDFPASEGVYAEFNVAEKLRGSFEEQSIALQRSVGAPYMTRGEARARMNLPERPEADPLVLPLNTGLAPRAPAAPSAEPTPAEPAPEPEPEPAPATGNGHRPPVPA